VEEYMPPGMSKEEAIQLAMEQSELLELDQWDGLGVQLHTLAFGNHVAPLQPPPAQPMTEPKPSVG
jgi:hypothetical protein